MFVSFYCTLIVHFEISISATALPDSFSKQETNNLERKEQIACVCLCERSKNSECIFFNRLVK